MIAGRLAAILALALASRMTEHASFARESSAMSGQRFAPYEGFPLSSWSRGSRGTNRDARQRGKSNGPLHDVPVLRGKAWWRS